jgi:hypothetical protein
MKPWCKLQLDRGSDRLACLKSTAQRCFPQLCKLGTLALILATGPSFPTAAPSYLTGLLGDARTKISFGGVSKYFKRAGHNHPSMSRSGQRYQLPSYSVRVQTNRVVYPGKGFAEKVILNPFEASGMHSVNTSRILSAPLMKGSRTRPVAASSKTQTPSSL